MHKSTKIMKRNMKRGNTENDATGSSRQNAKTYSDEYPIRITSTSTLDELWSACISERTQRVQWKAVQNAVVNLSAAETIVWPYILQSTTSVTNHEQLKDVQSAFDKACFLLAVLTSWECREGGGMNALQFITNNDSNLPWKLCCESVFSKHQEDIQCKDSNDLIGIYSVATIQVHFVSICWAVCQLRENAEGDWFCDPVLSHISGVRLWNSMPLQVRELELKKQSFSINQEWTKFKSKEETKGGTGSEPVFIVYMIQKILEILEIEILKTENSSSLSPSDRAKKRKIDIFQTETVTEEVVDPDFVDDGLSDGEDWTSSDGSNAEISYNNQPNVGEIESSKRSAARWRFVTRTLELISDLLSSCSGRVRLFLVPYLFSIHWTLRCDHAIERLISSQSASFHHLELTQQLLSRVKRWIHFPIQIVANVDGKLEKVKPLNTVDLRSLHFRRSATVQKMCLRYYSDIIPDVIYAGVGLLCNPKFLDTAFKILKDNEFADLLHKLRLIDISNFSIESSNRYLLMNILKEFLVIPQDLVDELRNHPLYPTEQVLWDFLQTPPSQSNLLPSSVLSLPKLQTRFLSFADYLWRNFELVRLESSYEIRSDITDAIRRLRPVLRQVLNDYHDSNYNPTDPPRMRTEFSGWSRMALEITTPVEIKLVRKPLLGEKYFSSVLAEFSIDLAPCGERIRREWDDLGEHDVLFLVSVDARDMTGEPAPSINDIFMDRGRTRSKNNGRIPDEDDRTFPRRFGVQLLRGCKVVNIRDDAGTVLSDPSSASQATGTKRVFLVELDPTQFAFDSKSPGGTSIYQSLNLVIRRSGKTNNFRSVLETIRSLLIGMGSIDRVIPTWLQSVILGHGNPTESSYKSETLREYAMTTAGVTKPDSFLDYRDTFLNETHLRNSFADYNETPAIIKVDGRDVMQSIEDDDVNRLNYKVRIIRDKSGNAHTIEAVSYPFDDEANGNTIPFTPRQVEAITSGLSPGLTLVVGPPGTGKSDTAVQIISSLYHSFPTQRTVIIAHSNAALNDIFEKVMARGDIEERYLVRLGAGESDLRTESTHDFTKLGRVAYSLERRKNLLEQVQLLAESLGLSNVTERGQDGSSAYTCQTADFLNRFQLQKRIQKFEVLVSEKGILDEGYDVKDIFPFANYFGFTGKAVTFGQAKKYLTSIHSIFAELAEYRPFELLRSQRQRADYLIIKQTRVVAMTCTHAAIARSHLIELGFEYDNVVIEEAGQMLEIETFVPLLLQRGDTGTSTSGTRLKRLCLMGDHNQLPPVIQNGIIAKFSNLDQSLFSRLIRLGVPYIQLDKQGRSRPEISSLYSWRYQNLGNLDHIFKSEEYLLENPGMAHTIQLINVGDFDGKGETSPSPYFYQNLGEAEYVVAVFQFLVLIGYPPEKISILTTYNGQKDLINDVIAHRCGDETPLAGIKPLVVSTVDQYQGQQNDIILLSLVRTKAVGHLRDIRRLIVAVSRARLGLYIFCRQDLFSNCHELKPTLDQFQNKPSKLTLVLGESYPTTRRTTDSVAEASLYDVDDAVNMGHIVHKMQQDLLEYEE